MKVQYGNDEQNLCFRHAVEAAQRGDEIRSTVVEGDETDCDVCWERFCQENNMESCRG